jgi:hypothetical protein
MAILVLRCHSSETRAQHAPQRSQLLTGGRAPGRGYPGGYFGIFRAFATPFGYIIIDSDMGYSTILQKISRFAQILLSGYWHFASNFCKLVIGYIIIDSDIAYFGILLQISGIAQIQVISGYSHLASNFFKLVN